MATARTECADTSSILAQLDFDLPADLIAQQPAPARDSARLMVVERSAEGRSHHTIKDLPGLLAPGSLLVVNDTRVIPARVHGRLPTGGRVELLAVRPVAPSTVSQSRWICLAKPAKRLRPGLRIVLEGEAEATVGRVLEGGRCEVELHGDSTFLEYLESNGEVPLPPYIRRPDGPLSQDQTRYQTIFARPPGAIAAPTAGLHFTDRLLAELADRGIEVAPLTLHVGPGTFLPIRDDDLDAYTMEPEWYEIPQATAEKIASAKDAGRAVVAVGTTTTRALESAAATSGEVAAGSGWAGIFITPGYRFRVADALFTNFHLPKSTLLLLVSAFAGTQTILAAYRDAVERRYRFYSYGDAMLLR
jgi:S-adenosylmethionine:tRNA ribosyltransferase-isomerase